MYLGGCVSRTGRQKKEKKIGLVKDQPTCALINWSLICFHFSVRCIWTLEGSTSPAVLLWWISWFICGRLSCIDRWEEILHRKEKLQRKKCQRFMHLSICNINIPPPSPRAYHGHLTPSPSPGVGHLTNPPLGWGIWPIIHPTKREQSDNVKWF